MPTLETRTENLLDEFVLAVDTVITNQPWASDVDAQVIQASLMMLVDHIALSLLENAADPQEGLACLKQLFIDVGTRLDLTSMLLEHEQPTLTGTKPMQAE